MKLRNKETGEIRPAEAREDGIYLYDKITEQWYKYALSLLAEYWEYYEEPKEYWYIDENGFVCCKQLALVNNTATKKEIGNYFETKEEAEKAVEKLRAWKRLKDKGFRFTAWKNGILLDETVAGQVRYEFPIGNKDDIEKDLDLLFSQEDGDV